MATSVSDIHIPDWRLKEIVCVANDWILFNGLRIHSGDNDREGAQLGSFPYALYPSVVPAHLMRKAKATVPIFNRLMHKVAMDHQFLENCLKNVIRVDAFICRLWDIYLQVRQAGLKQPLMLGLFRNDFMMETANCDPHCEEADYRCLEFKQLEFNVIASAGAGKTDVLAKLHRITLGMCGKQLKDYQLEEENRPSEGLASGLVKAWELYNNPDAAIALVFSNEETSYLDQRLVELKLYELNPRIRIVRKTFLDIHYKGYLDADSKLFIGSDEIAIVYLRTGYSDVNYPTEKEWNARLKLELSTAIKCPSVQYQLMGCKKIQQELARPGALSRFINDPAQCEVLAGMFAEQYSLDMGPEGDKAVQLGLAHPDDFVLKPQKEGGGHNLFNDDVHAFLTQHVDDEERFSYILMRRIVPWHQKNYMIGPKLPLELSTVVNEVGFFGVYLGSEDVEELNYGCGTLLKTKRAGTNEGGVCAGHAVHDNLLVV